jgi:hypothetical protein
MQAGSTSLTAHLARAAAANANHPSVVEATGPDDTSEPDEHDAPVLAADRCTVSVAPGQHCGRRAVDGRTVCAGHAAMLD